MRTVGEYLALSFILVILAMILVVFVVLYSGRKNNRKQ